MRINVSNSLINWYWMSYTLTGFDRLNFVRDITEAIPQDNTCPIAQLSFVGAGIQARVQFTRGVGQQKEFSPIQDRLRAVKGMVSVQTD